MAKAFSANIEEMCIKWYQCIENRDLMNAILLKVEIEQLLKQTKVNKKKSSRFMVLSIINS